MTNFGPRRVIRIDVSECKFAIDFLRSLIIAADFPLEHSKNLNAISESIVWGWGQEVRSCTVLEVTGLQVAGAEAQETARILMDMIKKHSEEYEQTNSRKPPVSLVVAP